MLMLMIKMVLVFSVSGRVRNIYFPFDIETDSALSVATEMVAELDMTDQDVTKIAEMIDGEITALVPEWKPGFGLDESSNFKNGSCCQNCASDGSVPDYLSSHKGKSLHILQCSKHGCGSVHGRFEEITYQVEGSEQVGSSQSDGAHYTDIWVQQESREEKDARIIRSGDETTSDSSRNDSNENEIWQELRWLKAKYKMQLRELTDRQLGRVKEKLHSVSRNGNGDDDDDDDEQHFTDPKVNNYESRYSSCSPAHLITANGFYSGGLLPHSLHRATSLPVDATDL